VPYLIETRNIRKDHATLEDVLNSPVELALLQEVSPRDAVWIRTMPGVLCSSDPPGAGACAILTRSGIITPLPAVDSQSLEPYGHFVIAGDVMLRDWPPLRVVCIHMRTRPWDVLPTLRALGLDKPSVVPYLEHLFLDVLPPLLDGRSCLVGGDLNAGRTFDEVERTTTHTAWLEAVERHLINCYWELHHEECRTFLKSRHPYQDDHLFLSQDWRGRLEQCYTYDTPSILSLNDHLPLVVEVSLGPPRPAIPLLQRHIHARNHATDTTRCERSQWLNDDLWPDVA